MEQQKKGSLMFISLDDLMVKFAKYNDLGKYNILVVSQEIIGSLRTREFTNGIGTGVHYESKYDNIEFVESIRPTSQSLEFAGVDTDRFFELYTNHLLSVEPFTDLCSIVDMIVNENCKVIIVVSSYEQGARIPYYLKAIIEDEFHLKGYTFDEFERLMDAYENGKTAYQKVLNSTKFKVPDDFDGKHFDSIMEDIGDIEDIRKTLEIQKSVTVRMRDTLSSDDDYELVKDIFFNKFTEDLEDKVKEVLSHRSLDNIKDMCRVKRIRISPKATKEDLIDKLLKTMKLNAVSMIEYEET